MRFQLGISQVQEWSYTALPTCSLFLVKCQQLMALQTAGLFSFIQRTLTKNLEVYNTRPTWPSALIPRSSAPLTACIKCMISHCVILGQCDYVLQQRVDLTEKLSESEKLMKEMSQTWEEKLQKTGELFDMSEV